MKSKIALGLLSLAAISLTACEFNFSFPSSSNSSTTTSTTSSLTSGSSNTSTTSSTSAASSSGDGTGYYTPSTYSITKDSYQDQADIFSQNPVGSQKVLVVPVLFADYSYTLSQKNIFSADINDTFFGASGDTAWESLASFYNKSSYERLSLSGVVTPIYTSTQTADTFAQQTRSTGDFAAYYDPTWSMVEEVVAWYKGISSSNLTEYDVNGDGFIDSIYMIYLNPNAQNATYSTEGEDVFWAYTYWDYSNYSYSSLTNPVPMTYCWSSYDFMYEGYGSTAVDAHTYIHEYGHALGLDDYYSYTDGDWGAAGALDMMDYNILDHNAYSKMLLGWADPFVVDGTKTSTTITIHSFESSGDFVLVGNAWNGSVYDEYLLFEFYTPTGINAKDSEVGGYPGNSLRGFTVPGVKIYHVDARLGVYDTESVFLRYTDTLVTTGISYSLIASSNSKDSSYMGGDYKLLHLIEEGGVNTFKADGAYATNDTLFKTGDSFVPSSYSTFFPKFGRLNDNTPIAYSVSFDSVNTIGATMTFTKL